MKSDKFFKYIGNCLKIWIEQKTIRKPILVFADDHKSHITMELSVILYALLANKTHIMQRVDVSVFKLLKSEWKVTIKNWSNQPESLNSVPTKSICFWKRL